MCDQFPKADIECLTVNKQAIPHEIKNGNIFINLEKICQANYHEYSNWFESEQTQEFLKTLEKYIDTQSTDIIYNHRTCISNKNSWGHPLVAINISGWISAQCQIQVAQWLLENDGLWNRHRLTASPKEYMEKAAIVEKSEKGQIYCVSSSIYKENIHIIGKTKGSHDELKCKNNALFGSHFKIHVIKEVENRSESKDYIMHKLREYQIDSSKFVKCELPIIIHYFNKL